MTMRILDRSRLARRMAEETARFAADHPRSHELHERAKASLLDGVPMNWMVKWAGPFPLFVESASGARFRCVDGHEYIDFCLGDTGAMAGHGPGPTISAVERQLRRGITHMLPTEDAIWAGEELRRRFGLPAWQFTLSATDANRFSLRLARHITGRSKVVVHDHCYHGSVDETFAVLDDGGRVRARHGSIGPGVDVAVTTRVVDYNDVDGLARALADRDVAAVLIEPALTNVGIVLPAPGYLDAVRALTRETGTILIIDETHTICAGPGGATGAWDLEPDMLVIGKTIGGGIPVATYGMNGEIAERVRASITVEEFGRRRDRRDAGRLRPRPGRRASHARGGPDRRGLRDDAAPGRTLGCGGAERPARARRSMARDSAGCSRRVPLRPDAATDRTRTRGRRRFRARAVPPPVRHEPTTAPDPIPQHGADVTRDHGR